MRELTTLEEFDIYLREEIRKRQTVYFNEKETFTRPNKFLELLGNPEKKFKTIHVAGTSGKGSTCIYTSHMIAACGQKVGLCVSPHVKDIRERFQINNRLLSEEQLLTHVNKIIPLFESMRELPCGIPSYFEFLVCLSFYIFAQEKVDYAVIETGLGGSRDATNQITSEDKVCILTKIGSDHENVLGEKLSDRAAHKAGIIHKNNRVFSVPQEFGAQMEIEKRVNETGATLSFSVPAAFHLEAKGSYQKENAGIALDAVKYIAERDSFSFVEEKIEKAVSSIKLPGRYEVIPHKGKTLIFDSAHNGDKMKAFLSALEEEYPGKHLTFLVSFKRTKSVDDMIPLIQQKAKKIIYTTFFNNDQDLIQLSCSAKDFREHLRPEDECVVDVVEAFDKLLTQEDEVLVITGSLYLLGDVYPLLEQDSARHPLLK